MRAVGFAVLVVVSLSPLFAFDSARWMAKREVMSGDAARLREAYSNCVNRLSALSERITIPIELNPDGSVRTSLYAERAQIFRELPLVWAEDLVVTKLDADGKERLRLEADRCVIDREAKSGWVEGHARVTQGGTTFEGDGVYFSASDGFVTAYSGSDVNSSDLRFGGL